MRSRKSGKTDQPRQAAPTEKPFNRALTIVAPDGSVYYVPYEEWQKYKIAASEPEAQLATTLAQEGVTLAAIPEDGPVQERYQKAYNVIWACYMINLAQLRTATGIESDD